MKGDIMHRIRNILVPVDFSDASRHALQYACDVADATGASLHVIHIVEDPYVAGAMAGAYVPPPAEVIEELEKSALSALDAMLTLEQKAKYQAVMIRRTGSVVQKILGYLHTHPTIDLVVMSTHGRGGVARLMMGSVADKLVRAAPCPVLTLREPVPAATRAA
jgi:nucleotide-binding universal stress UspA family protein